MNADLFLLAAPTPNQMLILAAIIVGIIPVSYTHLTLPTNREV